MDTENLRKKYILWSNIVDLRSRGINITRTAHCLGVSRDTVKHLQSLSSDELFRKYQESRRCKLQNYEQAVVSLLFTFPSTSSSRPLRVAIPQRFFDSPYCPHRAGGRHLYTAQSCGVRRHLYPRPYPRLKFGFALHCAGKSFQALEVPLRSAIAPRSGSACRFAYSVQVIYRVLPAPGFHRWERPSLRHCRIRTDPIH